LGLLEQKVQAHNLLLTSPIEVARDALEKSLEQHKTEAAMHEKD